MWNKPYVKPFKKWNIVVIDNITLSFDKPMRYKHNFEIIKKKKIWLCFTVAIQKIILFYRRLKESGIET